MKASEAVRSVARGVLDGAGRMIVARYEPGDATCYRACIVVSAHLDAWGMGARAVLIWDGAAMALGDCAPDWSYIGEKLRLSEHEARCACSFVAWALGGHDGDAQGRG
jgi:hypothetical protein